MKCKQKHCSARIRLSVMKPSLCKLALPCSAIIMQSNPRSSHIDVLSCTLLLHFLLKRKVYIALVKFGGKRACGKVLGKEQTLVSGVKVMCETSSVQLPSDTNTDGFMLQVDSTLVRLCQMPKATLCILGTHQNVTSLDCTIV